MQSYRVIFISLPRITVNKSSILGLIISCSEIIKPRIRVVLLTCEQVVILCGSGTVQEITESLISVGIGNISRTVCQPYRP